MKSLKFRHLFLLVTMVALIAVWHIANQEPTNDRNWQPYQDRSTRVSTTPTSTILTNVRDWSYASGTVVSRNWQDSVLISHTEIERVWFGLARFSSIQATGHTFLSFELTNGEVYSLSIEARRELDEEYRTISGLFNQYELWYGWGTNQKYRFIERYF